MKLYLGLAIALAAPLCLGGRAPAAEAGPALPTLDAGHVLRGEFTQERHIQGFAKPLRSTGHFVLAPGRGLIWRAETPFAITTVITSAGLVQLVPGSEAMHMSASRVPFLAHLYAMLGGALAGDWQALQSDFSVDRSGYAAHWQVRLTPHHTDDASALPFAAITASGARFVDQIELTRPGGDGDRIGFALQIASGPTLSADEVAAFRQSAE
jgi:hypothetical protein